MSAGDRRTLERAQSSSLSSSAHENLEPANTPEREGFNERQQDRLSLEGSNRDKLNDTERRFVDRIARIYTDNRLTSISQGTLDFTIWVAVINRKNGGGACVSEYLREFVTKVGTDEDKDRFAWGMKLKKLSGSKQGRAIKAQGWKYKKKFFSDAATEGFEPYLSQQRWGSRSRTQHPKLDPVVRTPSARTQRTFSSSGPGLPRRDQPANGVADCLTGTFCGRIKLAPVPGVAGHDSAIEAGQSSLSQCSPPLENRSLTHSAADMTLVLAAESHIFRARGSSDDPFGSGCFRDLIDLLLNSETVYLTLPRQEAHAPWLVRELQNQFTPIKNAMCDLDPQIEPRLLSVFINFYATDHVRLEKWLRFQLLNPIVVNGHRGRLDGRFITDGIHDLWQQRRHAIWSRLEGLRPHIEDRLPEYLKEERTRFKTDEDLLLCYAFDVFKRAIDYSNAVFNTCSHAVYVPHPIRRRALSSVPRNEELEALLEKKRATLWSWGDYFVRLLADSEFRDKFRGPQHVAAAIAEKISRVREAIRKTGLPKWPYLSLPGDPEAAEDASALKLAEWVVETSRVAHLPYLKRDSERARRRGRAGGHASALRVSRARLGAVDATKVRRGPTETASNGEAPWLFVLSTRLSEVVTTTRRRSQRTR